VGHSEGIMRPLMLALGAAPLVGVPALIALGPVLLLAQVQPQGLKHWVTATGLDFATLLLVLGAVLLIGAALGVVFAMRAQRRRERRSEEGRMAPENAREVRPSPLDRGRSAALQHLAGKGRTLRRATRPSRRDGPGDRSAQQSD
jgi:hypothetical protein